MNKIFKTLERLFKASFRINNSKRYNISAKVEGVYAMVTLVVPCIAKCVVAVVALNLAAYIIVNIYGK